VPWLLPRALCDCKPWHGHAPCAPGSCVCALRRWPCSAGGAQWWTGAPGAGAKRVGGSVVWDCSGMCVSGCRCAPPWHPCAAVIVALLCVKSQACYPLPSLFHPQPSRLPFPSRPGTVECPSSTPFPPPRPLVPHPMPCQRCWVSSHPTVASGPVTRPPLPPSWTSTCCSCRERRVLACPLQVRSVTNTHCPDMYAL
jgi:hypothetical protein